MNGRLVSTAAGCLTEMLSYRGGGGFTQKESSLADSGTSETGSKRSDGHKKAPQRCGALRACLPLPGASRHRRSGIVHAVKKWVYHGYLADG